MMQGALEIAQNVFDKTKMKIDGKVYVLTNGIDNKSNTGQVKVRYCKAPTMLRKNVRSGIRDPSIARTC